VRDTTHGGSKENCPGTLATRVYYKVTEDNALVVDYQAHAVDKNTVGNFTSHGFYNLSGNLGSEILKHVIYINASRFLPINSGLIPTGQLAPVANTPMDFLTPTAFSARIQNEYEQLKWRPVPPAPEAPACATPMIGGRVGCLAELTSGWTNQWVQAKRIGFRERQGLHHHVERVAA